MIEKFISNYKEKNKTQVETINSLNSKLETYQKSLNDIVSLYNNKNFLKRVFDFPSRKKIKITKKEIKREISKIENAIANIDKSKNILFFKIKEELLKSNSQKNSELNNKFSVLIKKHDILSSIYISGKTALSHIQSAISSVASAESMETMDMVSNNKGISIMSTSINQTAASSVRNANNYVKKFNNELRNSQLTLKQINHDTNIETVDLIWDMFFDNGILDSVGSAMSLNALSNTKRELQNLYNEISKIVNCLNKDCQKALFEKQNQELLIDEFEKPYKEEVNRIFKINNIE
jgi:hypothetical protein